MSLFGSYSSPHFPPFSPSLARLPPQDKVESPVEAAVATYTALHGQFHTAVLTAVRDRDSLIAPVRSQVRILILLCSGMLSVFIGCHPIPHSLPSLTLSRHPHHPLQVDSFVQTRLAERTRQAVALLLDELHLAVAAGDLRTADALLNKTADKIDINALVPASGGRSALAHSVHLGLPVVTKFLFDCGGSLFTRDAQGKSVARTALEAHQYASLTQVVELGFGIDRREDDMRGQTLLHQYAGQNDFEVVKLLLHLKATVDLPCNSGRTALLYAAAADAGPTVRLLIDRGASPNWRDAQDSGALHLTSVSEIKRFLVGHGSRVTLPNNMRNIPCCLPGEYSSYKLMYANYIRIPPVHIIVTVMQGSKQWVDDKASATCMTCGVKFGFFTRRHHCRSSGLLVCDDCSSVYGSHGGERVRVCDGVFNKARTDKEPGYYGGPTPRLLDAGNSSAGGSAASAAGAAESKSQPMEAAVEAAALAYKPPPPPQQPAAKPPILASSAAPSLSAEAAAGSRPHGRTASNPFDDDGTPAASKAANPFDEDDSPAAAAAAAEVAARASNPFDD